MTNLILSNDSGTSLDKNVYSVDAGSPQLLMVPPPVLEVHRSSIDSYKSGRLGSPEPQNEAWVEFDGKTYVMGHLAQKEFDADINVKQVKYENAIRKILAAVGAIASQKGLPSKFNADIAALLPRIEWENRTLFSRGLELALKDFSFCDRSLCVNLSSFICRPEGAGLFWTRSRRVGVRYRNLTVVTLMFGYRDISIEVLTKGVASGTTKNLGMYWMLNKVQDRTSGQQVTELLLAIIAAGRTVNKSKFKHLVRSTDPLNRSEELAQIADAVKLSRFEYLNLVTKWLNSVVPNHLDEVIIGGGTAEYLQPELRNYFSHVPISWAAESLEDVRNVFNLPVDSINLCSRLTDVYGLYRCLHLTVFPTQSLD